MRKITSLVTTFLVASAVLVGGGAAQATTSTLEECVPVAGVAAWTETIPAVTKEILHEAEYKTVEISPAVQYKAAVYETEYEFVHKHGVKTRWETNANWNAQNNENSQGWNATGNTRQGQLISAEVLAKDAVTEQQLVKEAWKETVIVTPEQKIERPEVKAVTCDDEVPPVVVPQTKTLKWQLPATGTWPQTVFNSASVPCGTTVRVQVDVYPYTSESDKARTDALDDDGFLREGEDYGWAKSWSFENYTAPACALAEIPYPTLVGTDVCGAKNDTVTVDPAWVEQYGKFVNGPWIDTNYKLQNGKWVVDGSAQIKSEFRKTHIWAGTAGTTASDFRRWQMYPGTAPFVHEDTNTDCPPLPANPTAEITAVCGAADIVLTNPLINDANQLTASFVVYVDGEFYDAYSVESGGRVEDEIKFDEDSGDHTVEVFQAGTSEWKLLASEDVKSDCAVPPTEEPPTEVPAVTPPMTVTPSATPTPVVAAASVDSLAQTGLSGNSLWTLLASAGLALVLGFAFVVDGLLRKRRAVEVGNQE